MANKEQQIRKVPGPIGYNELREAGLEHIRRYSRSIWTDHGIHDPGITMLEYLCFSLVDLGYRTDFSMPDLDASAGYDGQYRGFFLAHEILQCNPLTINDYRKLILENVEGVRNVVIACKEKTFKRNNTTISVPGTYSVRLETEAKHTSSNIREIKDQVYSLLMSHRNLGEDFCDYSSITFLQDVPIKLELHLDVDRNANYKTLVSKIYEKLLDYISPTLPLYSLDELLAQGLTPDEIFCGVTPTDSSLGFVNIKELEHFSQSTAIYASDIKNLVMGIEGVKGVTYLGFGVEKNSDNQFVEITSYGVNVKDKYLESRSLTLSGFGSSSIEANRIVLTVNGMPFMVGKDLKDDPETILKGRKRKIIKNLNYTLDVPAGYDRKLSQYYSIQNELPETYGVGPSGAPLYSSNQRKAQAYQLKAYLSFFDQLLADYLEQLKHASGLLSSRVISDVQESNRTYFYHKLNETEIADISKIIKDYEGYGESLESEETALSRKERILDHLLARFNEEFVDYSIFSFSKNSLSEFDRRQSVEDRKAYLNDYPELSAFRSRSVNYMGKWKYSGLEMRILRRIGVDNPPAKIAPEELTDNGLTPGSYMIRHLGTKIRRFKDNRDAGFNQAFGLHILEHSLLTPRFKNALGQDSNVEDKYFLHLAKEGSIKEVVTDPYSFQVTVVLPGWLNECSNLYFRNIVENVIREEIPPHISVRTCWLDCDVMYDLEDTYPDYLKELYYNQELPDYLGYIISVFNRFRNIYPSPTITSYQDLLSTEIAGMARLDYVVLGETDAIPVVEIVVDGIKDDDLEILTDSEPYTFKATVYPEDATNATLTWVSSDSDVVAIDAASGAITSVAPGEAYIHARVRNGVESKPVHVRVFEPLTLELISNKIEGKPGKDVIEMEPGTTCELKATAKPVALQNTLKWTCDGAIKLTNGKVIAVKEGEGKLTVSTRDGKYKVECQFLVCIRVKSIKFKSHSANLAIGKQLQLEVEFTPANATNKKLIWTASPEKVVSLVDGNLTGKQEGETTISAVSADNNKISTECKICVHQPVTSVQFDDAGPITLNKGESRDLQVTVKPADVEYNIEWRSVGDDSISLVNGKVTAIKSGHGIVEVRVDDLKPISIDVNVINPATGMNLSAAQMSITVGKTAQVEYSLEPKDADKPDIKWESSNVAVATVDSDGVVKGVKAGSVRLTVAADIAGETKKFIKQVRVT